MSIIYDLFQQYSLGKLRKETNELSQEVRDFKGTHRSHDEQIKSSALILESIWELVKERTGLDDQDLMEKITEVDLRDGVADGKRREKASTCLGCGRKISNRFQKCYHCGVENNMYSVFIDL